MGLAYCTPVRVSIIFQINACTYLFGVNESTPFQKRIIYSHIIRPE